MIVRAGSDNHEAIVKVIRKEYRAEDKVPILMDRIMHIIRRCIDDELKQL